MSHFLITRCGLCLEPLELNQSQKGDRLSSCPHEFHKKCWVKPEYCPSCKQMSQKYKIMVDDTPKVEKKSKRNARFLRNEHLSKKKLDYFEQQ